MEYGRAIKLFNLNSPTEVEITTEAIQFLQSLSNPVSIISIIGSPQSGKSEFADKILERTQGFAMTNPTRGL